jgi:predicted kinase
MVPFVILFTGLPGSGKTTLSRPTAEAFHLPILHLDTIKEAIFDSVGYSTRAWSEFVSTVGREIGMRQLPETGPCLLDMFMPLAEARTRLRDQAELVVEIHCDLPYETAYERFSIRARSGQRHPGHLDTEVSFEHYKSALIPYMVDRPFRLGGPVLEVDTSREVDLAALVTWTNQALKKAGGW